MSRFIHPENQKLLWTKLSKTVCFKESIYTTEEKHSWFKEIIELFYQNSKHVFLSNVNLKEINRRTILHMINELTNANRASKNVYSAPEVLHNSLENSFLKKDMENKNSMAFQERQKEYETMMKQNIPIEVNFNEKIEDEVITNMDELVKRHKEQREIELGIILPSSSNEGEPRKMIDIQEVFTILENQKPAEKHIQWLNPLEETKFIDPSTNKLISPDISPPLSPPLSTSFINNIEKQIELMYKEMQLLREMVENQNEEIRFLKQSQKTEDTMIFHMQPNL